MRVTTALLLLPLLPIFACGEGVDEDQAESVVRQAVINGLPVENALPAVGVLLASGADGQAQIACSAALIGPRLLLTVAHCLAIFSARADVQAYIWFADTVNCGAPGILVAVDEVFLHPLFAFGSSTTLSNINDIGVARLAREITEISPMRVLAPGDKPGLTVGAKLRSVGFGQAVVGSGTARKRLGLEAEVSEIESGEFSLLEVASHVCFGDSGGPALLNLGQSGVEDYAIAGVVSRGPDETKCMDPRVFYTRVDTQLEFIREQGAFCGDGTLECPVVNLNPVTPPAAADLAPLTLPPCDAEVDPQPIEDREFYGCSLQRGPRTSTPAPVLTILLLLCLGFARRRRA